MKVGDKVRYACKSGSLGEIKSIVNGRYYVVWSYGLDSRGEQVTATSGLNKDEFYSIPGEKFKLHITRRFNSGICPCGCIGD